jgi:uncharacterized protein (TIGR02118 family)
LIGGKLRQGRLTGAYHNDCRRGAGNADPGDNTGLARGSTGLHVSVTKSPALGEIEWQKLSSFTKIEKRRSIRQFFGSHSARKENSRSEEIRHHYGRGRSSHRAERDSLVATLYFDSADALKAGLASAEDKAAAGDLANFADGGAELYFFDTKEV